MSRLGFIVVFFINVFSPVFSGSLAIPGAVFGILTTGTILRKMKPTQGGKIQLLTPNSNLLKTENIRVWCSNTHPRRTLVSIIIIITEHSCTSLPACDI